VVLLRTESSEGGKAEVAMQEFKIRKKKKGGKPHY